MQRPIEFRAYSKVAGMTKCFTFEECADGFIDSSDIESGLRWEVMQWTGLIDKNKRKIFEGDLVVLRDIAPRIVIYQNGFFQLKNSEGVPGLSLHESEKYMTVIGNRFQNPELLK